MDQSLYKISTLAEHPEHFDDVINLIEEEFHYQKPHSFTVDFAPLVQKNNFHNCFIIIEITTNKIVAHLGVLPREMIKNNIILPIIIIGGITTNKNHQRKNLFKTLMNHALSLYKNKVAIAFLWSELNGVYEKFSFNRAGGVLETGTQSLTDTNMPLGFSKTKFHSLSREDLTDIKNIYQNFNEKYFFTLKRDLNNWNAILKINSIDLYIKKNHTGHIESYFCVGKGKDLTSIIHEIGSNFEDYHELINQLSPYKMWLPETEKKYFIKKEILYSSFVKILNREILHKFLYELTNTDLAILNKIGEVELSYQGDTFSLTEKDFIEGLLGPSPLEEFEGLSLSPYITGTDSI